MGSEMCIRDRFEAAQTLRVLLWPAFPGSAKRRELTEGGEGFLDSGGPGAVLDKRRVGAGVRQEVGQVGEPVKAEVKDGMGFRPLSDTLVAEELVAENTL